MIAERPALHTDDEAELLDLLGQVDKREAGLLAFLPVKQLEHLEIAKQLVAGTVPLGKRIEVPASLTARNGQVATSALLLDQQNARPEQVDEAVGVVQSPDVFLVPRDGAPPDAENVEEFVVEALRLALLVCSVRPLAGKGGGARPDLVPGKPHRLPLVAVQSSGWMNSLVAQQMSRWTASIASVTAR